MAANKSHPLAFGALLLGNAALAFGPWLVRLANVGPAAAGFWRSLIARERPAYPLATSNGGGIRRYRPIAIESAGVQSVNTEG